MLVVFPILPSALPPRFRYLVLKRPFSGTWGAVYLSFNLLLISSYAQILIATWILTYWLLSQVLKLGPSRLWILFVCCSLFDYRALKTRGNTPKYGLIFHSSFIGRASQKNKGRMARYLANKCSIASRIDCYSGQLQNFCLQTLHKLTPCPETPDCYFTLDSRVEYIHFRTETARTSWGETWLLWQGGRTS